MNERFNRNELFFGKEGQAKLRATRCSIIGVGGLGTHVVQQLALLGVGGIALVEPEEISDDNRNRYIGAWHTDPVPGSHKTVIAERLVRLIDPSIDVISISEGLATNAGFAAVRGADYVFGCVDKDGIRLILTEACAAYGKFYIDSATDIDPGAKPMTYGGRVHFSLNGESCPVCMQILDPSAAGKDLESADAKRDRQALYGIGLGALDKSGPSVVSVNGVVASLAVTEFMVHVTGIRPPKKLLTYYGHRGTVTTSNDPPMEDCYYCKSVWGKGIAANVERYIESQRFDHA
jgi:molybdopterin/thiamine biosynthesis adenylyltransferase